MRIGERTVVDKHDFGQDQRAEAERYLGVARTTCKTLSERIAATTATTSIDMTQMMMYYPPEQVAEQYGEQVYSDITSKIEGAVQSAVIEVTAATGQVPDARASQ